jgi:hypothetical protein
VWRADRASGCDRQRNTRRDPGACPDDDNGTDADRGTLDDTRGLTDRGGERHGHHLRIDPLQIRAHDAGR